MRLLHNTQRLYKYIKKGKRIKIQAHYECRRHETPEKPRVKWGQSPKWNPGYTRTQSNIELRRSGTITRVFVLLLGSAAPLRLNRCVPIINPGLTPWAMQEYRPYRAPLRLPYHFIILRRLPCWLRSYRHEGGQTIIISKHINRFRYDKTDLFGFSLQVCKKFFVFLG